MAAASAQSAEEAVGADARTISRGRHLLVWVLIVVASVICLVGVMTVWVKRQMLDNGAWNRATQQVIQDGQVRSALATYMVNSLYTNVDVQQRFAQRLPDNLKALAGPLAGALRQPATDAAERLLARPRVQQLFINASSVAHEKLVNVLENKTGFGISTGNGVVTLDVHELIVELGQQLGIPQAALDRLPGTAGVFTIMKSDQLHAAQKGVRLIRVLSVWILVAVFVLYGLAIYLGRGIRRQVLRNIGWSLLIVGLLVLIVRRITGNYAIDALTSPENHEPVRHVWLIETQILGQIAGAAVLYGILAILAATLAGPTWLGKGVRRAVAPTLNRRPGVVWFTVGMVYLLLIWWGPTHALRQWWGILLIAALIALGVFALRRQTLREYPDAEGLGLAEAVSGRASGGQTGSAPAKPAASPAEEIARLAALRDAGEISSEEFARAKELALS
jgi:hypothetical protein